MLASIMPGLREIRTPLAVGYAWVLVLYLAFAHRLPDAAHASGALADAYRIGRLVTPTGIAIAASVAAYLVGVIVLPATSRLTKLILRWRRITPHWLSRLLGTSPEDQVTAAFEAIAVDRLADRVRDDAEFRAALVRHGVEVSRLGGAEIDQGRLDEILRKNSFLRRQAINEALDDWWGTSELNNQLPVMVQRMRGSDDQAAAEYDRLTSESDFRAGMAWPLLALLVVLAARASMWWLFGLPAVLLLISSASAASLQATMLLGAVIASRRYEEPAMQVLENVPAQQMLSRNARSADWASNAARVVTALAFSPDNLLIAGGTDDGYVLIWDVATGDLRCSLAAHRDRVEALVFTSDGAYLASSGWDTATCVWEVASGNQVQRIAGQQMLLTANLAIEPGTGLLVAATWSSVIYWDLTDGTQVKRRTFDNSGIASMSMSPDGTLAVGLHDNSVVVVRDDQTPHIVKSRTGELIRCCALNGGTFIALESDKDDQHQIVRWRQSGSGLVSSVVSIPREPYTPIVVADYGPASTLVCTTVDDEILVLSLDEEFALRTCGDHAGGISALAVSSDQTTLVSASYAGTVQVREFSSGKLMRRLASMVAAP